MEITSIVSFLDYYERIRGRTLRVISHIPPERIDWTYRKGKFTFGDLIRHIAAIERFMFAETIQGRPARYTGCGRELADGYDDVIAFLHETHQETIGIISRLRHEDLYTRCITPAGTPLTLWKWLRAMVEHEIHHRGQIFIYLGMLDLPVPPLFGLTSEQVRDLSIAQEDARRTGTKNEGQ